MVAVVPIVSIDESSGLAKHSTAAAQKCEIERGTEQNRPPTGLNNLSYFKKEREETSALRTGNTSLVIITCI